MIEEQLSDGREWLFDTTLPGLGDVSIQFTLTWIKGLPTSKELWDTSRYPLTLSVRSSIHFSDCEHSYVWQWLNRVEAFLKGKQGEKPAPTKLNGSEAADTIYSAQYEPYNIVGFDQTESRRLGVHCGDIVSIAPEDTGKCQHFSVRRTAFILYEGRSHATTGKLVALSVNEAVVEVTTRRGTLRCHFPRLGYVIRVQDQTKL